MFPTNSKVVNIQKQFFLSFVCGKIITFHFFWLTFFFFLQLIHNYVHIINLNQLYLILTCITPNNKWNSHDTQRHFFQLQVIA